MRTLDLWLLPLRPDPADEALMDARERARLDRLKVAAKRDQLLAAQAGLRRVMATYTATPAAGIEFDYGPHGKPSLRGRPALGFNLSHSARLAIVGVAEGIEIGVDLEWVATDRPFERLARRYFDPLEAEWLAARSAEQVRAGFYRIWTLKEAYLKALGTGLTVSPSSFRIGLEERPPRLLTAAEGDSAARWHLATPDVGDGFAAAVCSNEGPLEIRKRRLDEA